MARAAAALPEPSARSVAIAALNGLYGDRLEAEGSSLAIPMAVRRTGATITPHVVVFLHGLGETEHAWGSPNYGDLLDDATPVFVRFNTGRHISENGADARAAAGRAGARLAGGGRADHADRALDGRPRRPQRLPPRRRVDARTSATSISLGTPHTGAPLEQAVHALSAALHLAPETRPFARFLRRRSAGIRDLRRGSLVDEDWRDQDPDALRARALRRGPAARGRHALLRLGHDHPQRRRTRSAACSATCSSSRRPRRARRIGFAAEHGLTLGGTHHLALLNHPAVGEQLRVWLSAVLSSTKVGLLRRVVVDLP